MTPRSNNRGPEGAKQLRPASRVDASQKQAELMARIMDEHQAAPHPGVAGGQLRIHVAVHTVVETQLEQGKPAETTLTLERLMEQGLTRHDAVHAIGTVVTEEILHVLREGRSYDEERFVLALRRLQAEEWLRPPQASP